MKGKINVTADALSRIRLTSDELKSMNEDMITIIMTRGLKRREVQNNEVIENNSNDVWPNQPNIVDVLKQPNNCIELLPTAMSEIKPFSKDVTDQTRNFYYIPLRLTLYVNQNPRST